MTDEGNISDTVAWVWSGLSKSFKSQHRHLRPSQEKAHQQPPNQPPAFLLCQLMWNRTPLLCYFKHIITLLLNQKILSDFFKKQQHFKIWCASAGSWSGKGNDLAPQTWALGKVGDAPKRGSQWVWHTDFYRQKTLESLPKGSWQWEHATVTPDIHWVTAALVWTGCELGDEG